MHHAAAAAIAALAVAHASADSITDFNEWTLFVDPQGAVISPFLSGSSTPTAATLSAGNGRVEPRDDIGFATTNANTVAASTSGFAFSKDADFKVAIDFDLAFASNPPADGLLGLGFGIGEDRTGNNAAGVALGTSDGSPVVVFTGAARSMGGADQLQLTLLQATLSGSLIVEYKQDTGNVTVGASTSKNASDPDLLGSTTFAGIQNTWNEQDLLVSFFINGGTLGGGWNGGDADAVFQNFRVLDGTPYVIPEPAVAALLATGLGLLASRRRCT